MCSHSRQLNHHPLRMFSTCTCVCVGGGCIRRGSARADSVANLATLSLDLAAFQTPMAT